MKNGFRMLVVGIASCCLLLFAVYPANSTSMKKMNIADLTSLGSDIVVGTVVGLIDGFDGNGLPYTEVTVLVSETVKGGISGTYTFRQFGLLAPRDMGGGQTYVGVSPDGFPQFAVDEEVMLFLFATTSLGFQSTVGLMQGKFSLAEGQVCNAINNESLFVGVSVDPGQLTTEEQKLLNVDRGAIEAQTFKSFVSKAVANGWFE